MKKLLAGIAIPLVLFALIAAVPAPPSTAFTRTFLRSEDAATARSVLGVSGGGGSMTNDTTVTTNLTVIQQITYNVAKGGRLEIQTNITIMTNASITLSNMPWPSVLLAGADGQMTNAALVGLTLVGRTLTASGGLATSGSAYSIVGGSAIALTNGLNLLAAYVTAKAATPHGAALSANNRYVIVLLPGVYDMGASTLTLDTEYIDIVGLSENTGTIVYEEPIRYGETVITSSATPVNITVGNQQDIALINLCLKTTTSGTDNTLGTSQSGFLAKLYVKNVLFVNAGAGSRAFPWGKTYNGTWVDCRCYTTGAWGPIIGGTGVIDGTFIRCRGGVGAFGGDESNTALVLSGTFIDCEGSGRSFGGATIAGGTVTISGTFIRCRHIASTASTSPMFGQTAATVSGTFIDCEGNPGSSLNFGGKTIQRYTTKITTYSISVGSMDTNAAVNIDATGWTNTFGKQAVVYFDGTGVTATVYNSAGTAIYTNSIALAGGSIILQPSGKVILSGTGVTGRATVF